MTDTKKLWLAIASAGGTATYPDLLNVGCGNLRQTLRNLRNQNRVTYQNGHGGSGQRRFVVLPHNSAPAGVTLAEMRALVAVETHHESA